MANKYKTSDSSEAINKPIKPTTKTEKVLVKDVITSAPVGMSGDFEQKTENRLDSLDKKIDDRISDVTEKLNKKISDNISDATEKLNNDFRELKEKTEKTNKFIIGITIGVLIVVALGFLSVMYDYLLNNEQRYERFIDKTEEIKDDFYSKKEVDKMFKSFRMCIWNNGLNNCLKQ